MTTKRKRKCRVCLWRPATHRGRCVTCYNYWWRTGQERPEDLVVRHGRRVLASM